jgi:hypothetical protein
MMVAPPQRLQSAEMANHAARSRVLKKDPL